MIKLEVYNQVDCKWWNNLVRSVPEGTIYQTTYWADYIKECYQGVPFYFIGKDQNKKVVVIMLAWKENLDLRVYSKYYFYKYLAPFFKKNSFSYGQWLYGPLVLKALNDYDCIANFFNKVDKILKNEKLIFLRNFALPMHRDNVEDDQSNSLFEFFSSNRFSKKQMATICIDLRQDANVLWSKLKNSAKKAINKCNTQGVTINFLKERELGEYECLIAESRSRINEPFPPYYPNHVMWKMLREKKEHFLEIFTARHNGKLLAALGILIFNGIIFEIASAQSNFCLAKKIYANDLIKWEVIKWGKKNNYRFYDLSGVSPNPKTIKEKGIRQFKEKWGGKLIEYTVYSRIYRKNIFVLYSGLKKIYNLRRLANL